MKVEEEVPPRVHSTSSFPLRWHRMSNDFQVLRIEKWGTVEVKVMEEMVVPARAVALEMGPED